MSRHFCHNWWRGHIAGIWWVEASDAVEHPTVHMTVYPHPTKPKDVLRFSGMFFTNEECLCLCLSLPPSPPTPSLSLSPKELLGLEAWGGVSIALKEGLGRVLNSCSSKDPLKTRTDSWILKVSPCCSVKNRKNPGIFLSASRPPSWCMMSPVLNLCSEKRCCLYSGIWWYWGKKVESRVGSEPLLSRVIPGDVFKLEAREPHG